MTRTLVFIVDGTPAPKGSFRISRRRGTARGFVVRKDSDATEAWEQRVAWAARAAMGRAPLFSTPVEVTLEFWMPRPKSVKRALPSVKPDWDKLARSTCDALTSTVIVDDALIVDAVVRKRYAAEVGEEGATITVRNMPDDT